MSGSTLKSPFLWQTSKTRGNLVPICDIVRPIVKEARLAADFQNFSNDLDELIDIAMSNRPGPVWLDIPLELQWQDIPRR